MVLAGIAAVAAQGGCVAKTAQEICQYFEDGVEHSEDTFSTFRTNVQADTDFSFGKQWPDGIRSLREAPDNNRPCITVNKIDPNVRRIVNEARQQKLHLEVKPVNDQGDPQTALAIGGLIRNTEYISKAQFAYMWAYECAVRAGIGWIRIDDKYEDEDSFDLITEILRVRNPLSVYGDPDSDAIDGRDQTIICIREEISEAAAAKINLDQSESLSYSPKNSIWKGPGGVGLGQIFWIEETSDTLYLAVIEGKEDKFKASEISPENLVLLKGSGVIKKEKKTTKRVVKWAKLCSGRVITQADINCSMIPMVPVYGREAIMDGKPDWRGITRNSIDSARMYNYMSSLMVERIALAPRAPWLAAAGQIEGYEDTWANSNVKNVPVLEYNPKTLGGQLVPPPQRSDAASGDPSVERYMNIAAEDVKTTSSIFDASFGNKGNEVSARAINARVSQGSISTYDFLDNFTMSLNQVGNILIDKYPRIVTPGKLTLIIGADGIEQMVKFGEKFTNKDGKEQIYNLNAGKYKVTVDIQAGDATRRESVINALTQIMSANPNAAALLMDIFVANLDIKDAQKIALRFKSQLPKDVLAAENGEETEDPAVEAIQQHAEQIITQLKQALDECQKKLQDLEIKDKAHEGDLEIKRGDLEIKREELELKKQEMNNANADKAFEMAHNKEVDEAQNKVIEGLMETQDALAKDQKDQKEGLQNLMEQIKNVLGAVQNLSDTTGDLKASHEEVKKIASKPKKITVQRDENGMIVGAMAEHSQEDPI